MEYVGMLPHNANDMAFYILCTSYSLIDSVDFRVVCSCFRFVLYD